MKATISAMLPHCFFISSIFWFSFIFTPEILTILSFLCSSERDVKDVRDRKDDKYFAPDPDEERARRERVALRR